MAAPPRFIQILNPFFLSMIRLLHINHGCSTGDNRRIPSILARERLQPLSLIHPWLRLLNCPGHTDTISMDAINNRCNQSERMLQKHMFVGKI